jgi:hypothetical protein
VADTDPWFLAEELRTLLAQRLNPVPKLIMPILGGEVIWEDCCESGGQLAVSIARIYPVSPQFGFPNQAVESDQCPGNLAVAMNAWVIRCWPSSDEEGNMPAIPVLQAAGVQLAADMRAVGNAALEQVGIWQDRYTSALAGDTLAVGPEGGCIGVSSLLTVELDPT